KPSPLADRARRRSIRARPTLPAATTSRSAGTPSPAARSDTTTGAMRHSLEPHGALHEDELLADARLGALIDSDDSGRDDDRVACERRALFPRQELAAAGVERASIILMEALRVGRYTYDVGGREACIDSATNEAAANLASASAGARATRVDL